MGNGKGVNWESERGEARQEQPSLDGSDCVKLSLDKGICVKLSLALYCNV